jgi:hypothetical protein
MEDWIKAHRPELPNTVPDPDPVITFFNDVMRPVLKQIHIPLTEIFGFLAGPLPDLPHTADREAWIKRQFAARPQLAAALQGAFLSWLTPEERAFYFSNITDLQKRLRLLILKRLADGWKTSGS